MLSHIMIGSNDIEKSRRFYNGEPATAANGSTIGFKCDSPEQVRDFHDVAIASAGGFWIASEGSATVGDAGRPINSLNFVFKTDTAGVVEAVVTLTTTVAKPT